MKKLYRWVCFAALIAVLPVFAATKKQEAVQGGTTVRTKVEAKGIYSQECYDAYYGCMDQFCITDNSNGGSCGCSNKNEKLEKQLSEILKTLDEADRVKNEEVERVELGAKADVVFGGGKRQYDADGNVVYDKKDKKASKKSQALAMVNKKRSDDDEEEELTEKGAALFEAADELCREQIEEDCDKDFKFLKQVYARQIESDCKAFENTVAEKKKLADTELASAESAVRKALSESFKSSNKYNQGECMVELKKCMQTADACGTDWTNCVSIEATKNIANSTASKLGTDDMFIIADSTKKIMEAKRAICERVLDQCMAVRDNVWTAFLKEVAPDLRLAESRAESKQRQSCLTSVKDCLHTACKDDIAGKGVATMDACLANPKMAKSFCKVELEACEKIDPMVWDYVASKLAAMRVDACTQEVKDCFTDPMRCGPNFENCIGMDYNFIHKMCPVDKLVVCKKGNPNFKMSDVDDMLMGLYLNVDNELGQVCEDLVNTKMMEICGSTSDCNRFAADDYIGTGSLASQKSGDIYRITGMISFGSIKIGDSSTVNKDELEKKEDIGDLSEQDGDKKLAVGKIGIKDYIKKVQGYTGVPNKDAIVDSIEAELNNIAGKINNVIDMIESDQKIQYCVTGRNLEQILGKKTSTEARFPNLLNKVKMQIAISALNKASDNYNKKLQEYIAKATKDADADVAQYMCQMAPVLGGAPVGETEGNSSQTLIPPYAISYEIGRGVTTAMLTQGGRGSSATGDSAVLDLDNSGNSIANLLKLGGQKVKFETGSGTREMWALFNRDSRICHFCTSTVTKDCSTVSKKGFLGIGASSEASCTESDPVEKCEDIQM